MYVLKQKDSDTDEALVYRAETRGHFLIVYKMSIIEKHFFPKIKPVPNTQTMWRL